MNDREAMKQALEALERVMSHGPAVQEAKNILREMLAQPDQEPESFEQWNAKQHGDPEEIGFLQALRVAYCAGQDSMTAGLTRLAQPEQEPLQFKCTVIDDAHPNGVPLEQWGKQPEQELVAWIYEDELPESYPYDEMFEKSRVIEGVRMFPVNVAPQRKKLPPQTPCLLTQAEGKMFRFGWLECEASHNIKGEA